MRGKASNWSDTITSLPAHWTRTHVQLLRVPPLQLQSFKRCTRWPCTHPRACRHCRSGRTPAPQCLHGASLSPVSSSVSPSRKSRRGKPQAGSRHSPYPPSAMWAGTVSFALDLSRLFPEPFGPRELVVGNVGSSNLPTAWGVLKTLIRCQHCSVTLKVVYTPCTGSTAGDRTHVRPSKDPN